ncbi:MAG TPA: sugar phosphate isomerase/epimerase family protein [Verrucomicrobiae bacterium]|nr:sugar phosphate isomerase/epimerase family protein [Verrucomicrobiae bacterium]
MTSSPSERVAVCSWSLQPADVFDLLQKLEQAGISRVQLALDPLWKNTPQWNHAAAELKQAGISVISGMFGCAGEDYSSLESIRRTGGIAPDETWDENQKRIDVVAEIAAAMLLPLVTFHAGFLPHQTTDPNFSVLLYRVRHVADVFAKLNINVAFETGQETAPDLAQFLESLDAPNAGVNFDPANMLLYDKGDPIAAVRTLAPWIRQVHIKDAQRTQVPGTWGREVPVGSGEVNWAAFFGELKAIGYAGDFVIEREAASQRVADVRLARELIERFAA